MSHGCWTGLKILAAVAATLWMVGAACAVKVDGQEPREPSRHTQDKPKWYEKKSPAATARKKDAATTASARVTTRTGTRRYRYSRPGGARPRPAPTQTPQVLYYRADEEPMAAPMMDLSPAAVPDPIELDRSAPAPAVVPDPIELDRSGKPQQP